VLAVINSIAVLDVEGPVFQTARDSSKQGNENFFGILGRINLCWRADHTWGRLDAAAFLYELSGDFGQV